MIKYRVKVDGREYEVEVEQLTKTAVKSEPAQAEKPPVKQSAPAQTPAGTEVKAPLAGTILSVKVKVGDQVNAGDVLLTLEALKLENEITSPVSGTVAQIISSGETVETDHVLAIIS
ncbi:MAG: biotin/lipoyl-containing protein [Candidatus Wallacebacter cryptica]|nr:biotin/lipoyl-binding protein [Bacillota bacterium]